jgi:hypothetical protein
MGARRTCDGFYQLLSHLAWHATCISTHTHERDGGRRVVYCWGEIPAILTVPDHTGQRVESVFDGKYARVLT